MQRSKRRPARAVAVLGLIFLPWLVSCRGPAMPKPGPETPGPAGMSPAAALPDIRVAARSGSWPGDRSVESKVAPVRIRFENHSDVPLMIRYSGLALLGSRGRPSTALPVFPIEAEANAPVIPGVLPRLSLAAYPPIQTPKFEYSGFGIAPFLKPLYPTIPAYQGDFPYDRAYYANQAGVWEDSSLPSLDMIERALPEGVLDPGGRVEGWVYFARAEPTLRAVLVNARSGRILGEARTPVRAD